MSHPSRSEYERSQDSMACAAQAVERSIAERDRIENIPTLAPERRLHIWPKAKAENRRPRPGDIARCGYVQPASATFPSTVAALDSGLDLCRPCELSLLRELGRL